MTITIAVRPVAEPPRRQAYPSIRIRPVPRLEPPTEAELAATGWAPPHPTAPVLPLSGRTEPMSPAPLLAPAGVTRSGGGSGDNDTAPAAQAAHRFIAACLEVLGGFRPVTHLRGLCAADAFTVVAQRLTGRTAAVRPGAQDTGHLNVRTPVQRRPGSGAPPRGARSAHPPVPERIAVRRVQIGEPRPGVAEVAVVLNRRDQVWAMALRLEVRNGRWLCTYLHVL